jgi:hypothetical protein
VAAGGERSIGRTRYRNRRRFLSRLQTECGKIFWYASVFDLLNRVQMNNPLSRNQLVDLDFRERNGDIRKRFRECRICSDAS